MPPSSPQLTILGATMEGASIRCSCTVEHLKETGEVLRRQPLKAAAIELGRNELRDIVLRLSHAEGKLGPFTLREHTVHRRFVKEGKASIVLKTQGIQILLSNCPPEQLRQFLGHLGVKLTARGRLQGLQKRMVGDVSLQFEEISPLGAKDFDVIKCRDQENISTPTRKLGAPDCKAAKRKLSEANANEGDPPACKVQALSASFGNHPVLGTRQKSPNLSQEQQRVLDAVKKGESVFFTGSAGTGKSWLLKRIIASLPPDTTFPTASTGVAACHIGGKTLHSFAGIGNGTGDLETCIKQASMEPSASQWRRCQCLIIDEISMIDAELFDKLEAIARAVRRSREPFGGIQLVLCGDFLQLPPVSKDAKTKEYCFQVGEVLSIHLPPVHLTCPQTHVHAYTYIPKCVSTCVYIHTRTCVYINTRTYVYINTRTCVYINTYMHIHTHTYMRIQTYLNVYTYTCTCIYIHMYIIMCIHTHVHE